MYKVTMPHTGLLTQWPAPELLSAILGDLYISKGASWMRRPVTSTIAAAWYCLPCVAPRMQSKSRNDTFPSQVL